MALWLGVSASVAPRDRDANQQFVLRKGCCRAIDEYGLTAADVCATPLGPDAAVRAGAASSRWSEV
jgi:hypothetical protein